MKLVSYVPRGSGPGWAAVRAGVLLDDGVLDLAEASGRRLPESVLGFVQSGANPAETAASLDLTARRPRGEVRLLAPLTPVSLRDFMAFEEHVKHSRELRGTTVPDAWYQVPVFYFSNHLAVVGPEDPVWAPPGCEALDYEFEVAIVIGKEGRDIPEASAWDHVAGLTIMNDWSARDLQLQEMGAGLGPAKGKDFATTIGPALVTMDELRSRLDGDRLQLAMVGRRNGDEFTRTDLATIHHPVPRIIARASAGVTLRPGEVLGLGTVGNGCLLETPDPKWLEPGDVIELEVELLGILRTEVVDPPGR